MLLLVRAETASSAVVGVLGLGSNGGVTATLTSLLFLADPSSNPPGPPWAAAVNNTTNLTFTGGPLNVGEAVEINNNTAFSGVPTDHFFIFQAHNNLDYSLTGVTPSGAQTNCQLAVNNGQTCSIFITGGFGESPVILQANGGGGTIASITLQGFASDTGAIGPSSSRWMGSFSPTIPTMTPLQIAQALCPNYIAQGNACTPADVAAARSINVPSNSGSFTAIVPEPGTLSFLMLGGGLILCGTVVRRLSQRS
jgi:hypothetical protein